MTNVVAQVRFGFVLVTILAAIVGAFGTLGNLVIFNFSAAGNMLVLWLLSLAVLLAMLPKRNR